MLAHGTTHEAKDQHVSMGMDFFVYADGKWRFAYYIPMKLAVALSCSALRAHMDLDKNETHETEQVQSSPKDRGCPKASISSPCKIFLDK